MGEGTDGQPTPEVKTFALGDELGQYKHTLLEDEMPIHNHRVSMTNDGMEVPTNDFSRLGPGQGTTQTNVAKTSVQILNAGGGLAHYNIQPYIAVHMWTRTI